MPGDRPAIRSILWAGQRAPKPASERVLEALETIEVTNDTDGPDGFQLTLTVRKDARGDYSLAREPALQPLSRVVIGVLVTHTPHVLINGLVTRRDVQQRDQPGAATLTITGRDLTQALDLDERNERYPNRPDGVIATQVIARHAGYGLVPNVTPTTVTPLELFRVPRQQETDLAFLRRLAERNGFIFSLEPTTFGVTEAYWGPELRAGVPQPALTVDMGEATNVDRLDVAFDGLAAEGVTGSVVEPLTKRALPLPDLPSLRLPPLTASPAQPARRRILRDTGSQRPAAAAVSAVAAVSTGDEPATATGELDAARYGHVLRARRPVGVRGAGLAHDGLYYVRRVTHRLGDGYTQSFTLSREGTGALAPVVPL